MWLGFTFMFHKVCHRLMVLKFGLAGVVLWELSVMRPICQFNCLSSSLGFIYCFDCVGWRGGEKGIGIVFFASFLQLGVGKFGSLFHCVECV